MKLLRLLTLSTLIILFALLLQSLSDKDQEPASLAAPAAPSASLRTGSLKTGTLKTEDAEPADSAGSPSAPLKPTLVNLRPTPSPPPPTATATPTAPQVATYSPRSNALIHDLHTPLILTFDIVKGASALGHSLQITPSILGQSTWRDDHTLVFTPDPGWTPGTRYQARLGDGWLTWFRTARLIESHSPSPSQSASPHAVIAIRFGIEVDRASVANAFSITPTVAGRLRWTSERRVVFSPGGIPAGEPDQPLDYLTAYHVNLDGELQDLDGQLLPVASTWSFTTRSSLVSAGPQGSADVESPIRLKFDTPMDQASVQAALIITPTISGSFDWQGNTLTYSPDDYLAPDTTYHVTLAASARDAAGRPVIAADHRWHFNTQPLPYTIGFGHGPNIQVLDAGGRRAVQVEGYNNRDATLRLYALDIPQFLDRYTSSFRGVGPGENKPVETADLPLALTWKQELDPQDGIILPATAPPGLYVLEAQVGPGRAQLIVVLTRYSLVLKQAERQLVTWASTMSDHAPAAAMHLRFYDRDGTLVAEGATEERGLHRTLAPVDTEPLIVVGELDGDVTVSGLANEWQVGNDWWWGWWKTSPSAPDATIYPYTDRPIYRPGQTVHARAVVRRDDDAVYSLPDGAEVVLRLRDARDNVIATRRRAPDEFGAVYADFEIADGGTVGTYHLEVSALGASARQSFLVEAYRKPDYEVTLTPSSEHVVAGEPLTLTVQANYFFGPPVAEAKVQLIPFVVGYDGWYSGSTLSLSKGAALDYGYGYEKLRRAGRTDANGRLTIVLPAGVTNEQEHQVWNIEATVADASRLSVSAHARVVVHRAAFGLSLSTDRYHYQPGEPIAVTALARDHRMVSDAEPQAGVELTVGLYARDEKDGDYDQLIVGSLVTTDGDGQAEVTLQTTRSGWYQLRAKGADSTGRDMQTQRWVLIYDPSSGLWDGGEGGHMRLSTDRDRYAPGDTASLLIESPVAGRALLSFERGTTRRETVIGLDEGLNTLEFEILPDDAPNVHVAVAVWRPTEDSGEWTYRSRPEQELLTARIEILVPADDKRLSVTITPDRSQYTPRDEALFTVEIRDHAGQPVRAGFSLALVDEAIFALAADKTPDIFDAFYSPRPDIVRTYHSLRPIRWLDWGMGGGGGGGEAPGGNPRSDFPDTAFWAPALATGDDGLAHVRVPLPDSLTDWRAVVRAISADTKAGQATANVTVALPLSIQPILPRFLVQGDHTTLRAVVHNHTGESQVATVRLSPTGLKLDAALSMTQPITLPANGAVAVEWPVVAEKLGQASVYLDVSLPGGEWHDAVLLPLPVMPLAIPQVDTVTAEVQDEWAETITLPDAAIPDVSRWEMSFAPSIATGMLDGLEFLIDYPFG